MFLNGIFWVTEGTRTKKTAVVYQRFFKRFLKHIKIDDLQVLADYSRTRPQFVKEMIVDYILYLRDEKPGKKLSRTLRVPCELDSYIGILISNRDHHDITIHPCSGRVQKYYNTKGKGEEGYR